MNKTKVNFNMLNIRRRNSNKKEVSYKDYEQYQSFKEKLLNYLKTSNKKKANGYLSIDAFLFIKNKGKTLTKVGV